MPEIAQFKQLEEKLTSFLKLPTDEIHYFFSQLTHHTASKGNYIIQAGKVCDCIWYVNGGVLRTFLTIEGRETNTEFFFENSFASAFTSFLLRTPTSLNIQTLEDCSLISISKELLEQLYQRNSIWLGLGKYIFEEEFIKKCKRESSLLQLSAKERYLSLLNDYPYIEARVPLFQIASYLGIQPESLSRIRSGSF